MQQIRRATELFVLSMITILFLSACGGGGGDAAAPDLSPTATTAAASSITNDNAVLNAVVNPKGVATTALFEYSKDSALASNVTSTTIQALGSGTADINVTQSITGLDQGTTYYYRVKATSSAGTKTGSIYTFNTLPLPTVTTNAATSLTTTGAVLNADVNPNGRATSAWFEYGTTTALGTTTDNQSLGSGSTNVQVAATLTTLSVATKYYFRIVAQSAAGTSRGTILNFTTAGGVPLVVTQAATSITASGGVLNAIVNPSALATYAWFEYGTTSSLGTVIDNVLRGSGMDNVSISKALTGLSPGTKIYYRVAASNSVGSAVPGDILNFTTLNPAPIANAGPDQTKFMNNPVTLNGSGSSDGYGGTLTYLWTQTAGPSATLSDNTAANPTFTAPKVVSPSQVLTFMLTVTSSRGPTATDNVNITVKWGFFDDFSTDTITTGSYVWNNTLGAGGTFTYDSVNQNAVVTTGGSGNAGKFTRFYMFGSTLGVNDFTYQGVFTLDFYPSGEYGTGGGISISLLDDAITYYRFSTVDGVLEKVRGGVVVDNVVFPKTYAQYTVHPITITFSPDNTTVTAFGTTKNISTNTDANPVYSFVVETKQQDASYDNIKLEALP